MRLTHLFARLLVLCSISSLAQSLPANSTAVTAQPKNLNSSIPDQFRISPYPQLDLEAPNALATESASPDTERQNQPPKLFDEQANPVDPATIGNPATDRFCFSIASYRMVRDDPHSDATHIHGYTTCVPSARFRIYTTDEKR